MNYRQDIDGLRAVAVAPVILYHAGVPWVPGGFIGVDIFFVISGFLITSIILNDIAENRFSIIDFYERRARRILPALVAVVVLTTPFAWWLMVPSEIETYGESIIATALFVSNIYFWTESGYFATQAEFIPLLHTWSLAVEEQFYILFPPLVFLLWKLGRGALWMVFALTFLASLATAEIMSRSLPSASFFLLPTRIWELLAGAMVALWLTRNPRPRNAFLSVIGLTMVLAPMLLVSDAVRWPSMISLVPVLGTVLILLFSTGLTERVLSLRLLVGLGLISYSAYLWHNPLFVYARIGWDGHPPAALMATLAVASIALAWLSWKFIEQPFRRRGADAPLQRRGVFRISGAALILLIGMGVASTSTRGFENYYLSNRLSPEDAAIYDLIAASDDLFGFDGLMDDGTCRFASGTIDPQFASRFATCADEFGPALLIVGDSHARNLYNAAAWNAYSPFTVGVVKGGCRAHDEDENGCSINALPAFVERFSDQIELLVYHQSGSYYIEDGEGRVNRDDLYGGDVQWAFNEENPERTWAYLERLALDVNVTWLGPRIESRMDLTDVGQFRDGFEMNPNAIEIFGQLDAHLDQQATNRLSGVRYASLIEVLGTDPSFLKIGECVTFHDIDHWSECGEALVGQQLRPLIDALRGAPR